MWNDDDLTKALPYFLNRQFVKPKKLADAVGISVISATQMIKDLDFEQWSEHVVSHAGTVYVIPEKYRDLMKNG